MDTSRKISILLIAIMSFLFVLLISNVIYNFRAYGLTSIESKAKIVAQVVKHSLTSHMVNNVMDNRKVFLEQIGTLKDIDDIWLVRSPAVIEQYGKGLNNEELRDAVDQKVLDTATEQKVINENLFGASTFRITIPYISSSKGAINCIECHTSKEGDVLGAISISMTMDDVKEVGINTITNTAIIALILTLLILYIINRVLNPFLTLFDSIKNVMKRAHKGEYSTRLEKTNSKEGEEVSLWINNFLDKLENTLNNIEKEISVFLSKKSNVSQDPLINVNEAVTNLSCVYKFRKTIEHDEKLEDIYNRISYVLEHKLNIKNFNILESDKISNEIKVVYEKDLHCNPHECCRTNRTNTITNSCQFDNICDKLKDKDVEYICIPYTISHDLDLIITMTASSKEELNLLREQIPLIDDYIHTAKPEIVTKKLMHILEKSARTDGLTGLFNRKFLEESVQTIVAQAKRNNIKYGILMIDIDYFKMVNDTYGHDVGDEAIRVIAQTLRENIRSSDIAVRYGGEEFMILLYNCEEEYVLEIAEKLRITFSQKQITKNSVTFSKTISIGASIFPVHTENFWECVKYADISLYDAKHSGRNKVVLFSKELLKNSNIDEKY
ncbi:MAG: GGDEF domain-containing protein [Arcobacteraceae bacterium]